MPNRQSNGQITFSIICISISFFPLILLGIYLFFPFNKLCEHLSTNQVGNFIKYFSESL